MNPILNQLLNSKLVPVPASTVNEEVYWLENKGSVHQSANAVILNCFDPANGNPMGGVAYVIHNEAHSFLGVTKICEEHRRHRTVITVNEAMAERSRENYNQVIWELCLTPVKVLDIVQEGYK